MKRTRTLPLHNNWALSLVNNGNAARDLGKDRVDAVREEFKKRCYANELNTYMGLFLLMEWFLTQSPEVQRKIIKKERIK